MTQIFEEACANPLRLKVVERDEHTLMDSGPVVPSTMNAPIGWRDA